MSVPSDHRFANLICPVDGSALQFDAASGAGADAETGLLTGRRQIYPVILGIPRLINDTARGPLVAMLRRGEAQAAADLALSWPDKGLSNRLRRKAATLLLGSLPFLPTAQRAAARIGTGRAVRLAAPTVEALLHQQQSGFFTDWLLHRFSARTFRPLAPLSRLISAADRVLDVGGGLGHGAWVLSARVPPRQITLVDAVFAHLYVAKTRMAPGLTAIAADVSLGLPFADPTFDCIVMSDTFHFVPDQPRLAADAKRLLTARGRLILSQIHNGLIRDQFTGHARSPQGYLDLFPAMQRGLLRNDTLLEAEGQGAEYSVQPNAKAVGFSDVAELSLVADFDGTVFGRVPPAMPDLRNPCLASILRYQPDGRLTRRAGISPVVTPFLDWPELDHFDTPPERLRQQIATRDVQVAGLLRTGILVSAPGNYFAEDGTVRGITAFATSSGD